MKGIEMKWGAAWSRRRDWIGIVGLTVALGAGCAESRECEAARIAVNKAYTLLGEEGLLRREAGVDKDAWVNALKKVDTLRSSFATKQVTWDSANNARDELRKILGTIKTDKEMNLQMFKTSAESAFAAHDELARECQ